MCTLVVSLVGLQYEDKYHTLLLIENIDSWSEES